MKRPALPSRRFRSVSAFSGLLAVVALVASACASTSGAKVRPTVTVTATPSTTSSTPKSTAPKSTKPKIPTKAINVTSFENDGSTWGIAMPIILYFNIAPTDSKAFTHAVKVTVNGKPADGAWYWEKSARPGEVIEAHYRERQFWPAHATIHVDLPIGGLSAGKGLSYSGALNSLTIHTGAATIGTVDGRTEKLTVTSDGKPIGVFPVALGAPNTPTLSGTKVIMGKFRNERMIGSGYDEIVPWSMRLTNSGEYLHAAAWNIANIEAGRPSSNGCTNMLPADAQKLFGIMQIGDPVVYNNVPGVNVHKMPSWDGFGGWNLPWATWAAGGELLNH